MEENNSSWIFFEKKKIQSDLLLDLARFHHYRKLTNFRHNTRSFLHPFFRSSISSKPKSQLHINCTIRKVGISQLSSIENQVFPIFRVMLFFNPQSTNVSTILKRVWNSINPKVAIFTFWVNSCLFYIFNMNWISFSKKK